MYVPDEGSKSPLYARMSIELKGYKNTKICSSESWKVVLDTTRGPIEGIYHEPQLSLIHI